MDFYKKKVNITSENWRPESLESRALREEISVEVRDAISESMSENRPFMINFVNELDVQVAQMIASGAMLSAAPLDETINWVNFGFTTQMPPSTFGRYPDRLSCENRIGNDSGGVDSNDLEHSQYHGHTLKGPFPVSISLSPSKRNVPEVGKQLSRKLFDKVAEENKSDS